MTRVVTLNAVDGGINRLRNKGGAKPTELYDLLNAYVTADGGVKSRPGTVEIVQLPAGTKGLCSVNGGLVVFSHEAKTIPASTPAVTCEILANPDAPTSPIHEIHFAGPFLGGDDGAYLYVVAEYENGQTWHFWLQHPAEWEAETAYKLGQLVEPTTPNGYAYRAHRATPPGIVWAPNVARAVGDVVEPTVANGFEYEVIDTIGDEPRSGTVEPTWPTEEGATINEDVDLTQPTAPSTGDDDGSTTLPDDVAARYDRGYLKGGLDL